MFVSVCVADENDIGKSAQGAQNEDTSFKNCCIFY